jgi:hypothetical protein
MPGPESRPPDPRNVERLRSMFEASVKRRLPHLFPNLSSPSSSEGGGSGEGAPGVSPGGTSGMADIAPAAGAVGAAGAFAASEPEPETPAERDLSQTAANEQILENALGRGDTQAAAVAAQQLSTDDNLTPGQQFDMEQAREELASGQIDDVPEQLEESQHGMDQGSREQLGMEYAENAAAQAEQEGEYGDGDSGETDGDGDSGGDGGGDGGDGGD